MAVSFDTGEIVRRSQGLINQAVDRGTGILADRVEHYTNVARDIGGILRDRGEPQAADMVQMIAERGGHVARYLRNNDTTTMWNDAQDLARGRTWLLAGAGFMGGLALARAVRTATGDYERRAGSWEDQPAYRDSYAQPRGMESGTGASTGYQL
ncbi:MAG TPA: hypothetical protein VJP85_06645 [Candidatus Baltobacteraceae bacterium]|nr:hypothetical protein [Candidatus Baltobacteraceae bacterium]